MRLLAGLFLWMTQKAVAIVALVLLLTILFLAGGSLRPLWDRFTGENLRQEIQSLEHRRAEIARELETQRTSIPAMEKRIRGMVNYNQKLARRILEECGEMPSWFHPVDRYFKEKECAGRERLVQQREKLKRLKTLRREASEAIQRLEKESLGIQTRLASLSDAAPLQRMARTFRENWFSISYIVLLVIGGPPIWKSVRYFVLARWAENARPLRLQPPAQWSIPAASPDPRLRAFPAVKSIPIPIEPDASLLVREGYLSTRENLKSRTRMFWKWCAPFISYAAGLYQLTEFSVLASAENGTAHVSSGNAGTYIAEIRLEGHPGIALHPKHIVGVSGNIRLRTRWVFFNLHSWLSGQHRFILFHGTGRIFVEGQEGVLAMTPGRAQIRVEEPLLMGFDSGLRYRISRTETFWPYFRGRARLFDLEFEGDGVFLRQIAPDIGSSGKTPAERIFAVFTQSFQAAGKFFGF